MARGDHIYVKRWRGMYTHHGIDVGDGTVIHFSGEPLRLKHACVVRDTLEVFCEGQAPQVVPYAELARSAEDTLETAFSHLGQTGYQLLLNNCEHFASYCKTGSRASRQVRRAIRGLAISGATVTVAGLALLVVRRRRQRDNA